MKFIHTKTGEWPFSEYQLDRMPVDERSLYAVIKPVQPVWYDSATNRLNEGDPVFTNGAYLQTWNAVPLVATEFDAIKKIHKADLIAQALNALRASDYVATADKWETLSTSEKAAWAEYREAMREVVRGDSILLPDKP